jgi:hypothetical protein
MIGLFGSVHSLSVRGVLASAVLADKSYIHSAFSDQELDEYEADLALPVGPPVGQSIPFHVYTFFAGAPIYALDGRVGSAEQAFGDGASQSRTIGNGALIAPGSVDSRAKKRIGLGDILVWPSEEFIGIVSHVSADAEDVTGYRVKLVSLGHWECFFTHREYGWDREFFGSQFRDTSEAYLLPLDWPRSKGKPPLADILRTWGMVLQRSLSQWWP